MVVVVPERWRWGSVPEFRIFRGTKYELELSPNASERADLGVQMTVLALAFLIIHSLTNTAATPTGRKKLNGSQKGGHAVVVKTIHVQITFGTNIGSSAKDCSSCTSLPSLSWALRLHNQHHCQMSHSPGSQRHPAAL